MDVIKRLECCKDKLEKKIYKELLLLGTDGPERLLIIDTLFDKMNEINEIIDTLYKDCELKRTYVKLSGYEHLDRLTKNSELYLHYHKLTDKIGRIIGANDKDGRIEAIE
jgi:hypothetical protein